MGEHSDATAPRMSFEHQGDTFTLSPPTDRDRAEMTAWAQGEILKMARESIPADASPQERQRLTREAYAMAAGVTMVGDCPGAAMLATPAGTVRYIWQLLRKEHRKLKLADVRAMVEDDDTAEQLDVALTVVLGGMDDDPAEDDTPPKDGPLKPKKGGKGAKKKAARPPGKSTGH